MQTSSSTNASSETNVSHPLIRPVLYKSNPSYIPPAEKYFIQPNVPPLIEQPIIGRHLCIQYLPAEINTQAELLDLIENKFLLGKTREIIIRSMPSRFGHPIYYAYIYMQYWNNTHTNVNFLSKLHYESEVCVNGYFDETAEKFVEFNYNNNNHPFKYFRFSLHSEKEQVIAYPPLLEKVSPEEKSTIFIGLIPYDVILDDAFVQTEAQLTFYFENKLKIGIVEQVDVLIKKDEFGNSKRSAFIHFSHWYNSEVSKYYREMLNTVGSFGCENTGYADMYGYIHYFMQNKYFADVSLKEKGYPQYGEGEIRYLKMSLIYRKNSSTDVNK
jgi:hypothetical protein